MGRDRTRQAAPDLFSTAPFGETAPPATKGASSEQERRHVLRNLPSAVRHLDDEELDRLLAAEPGLTHYLEEIRRFPMLERQEEYMLAKRWREHGDRGAAHKLVTSHLRLVTKIARDYRGYGVPISEAISEGNVGLMQAVERFEPEKGFRLAT